MTPFWISALIFVLGTLLGASAADPGSSVSVVIGMESAPPGGTVQLKFNVAKPQAIKGFTLNLALNPDFFGPISAVGAFSATGDAVGGAEVDGTRAIIRVSSASGSIGVVQGSPIAVVAVPIRADVQIGSSTTVTANFGTGWQVQSAIVSATGTLSIRDIQPAYGIIPVGATVRVYGSGFSESTRLEWDGVPLRAVRPIGVDIIDVDIAGSIDISGLPLRLRNPDGPAVQFYPGSVPARDTPCPIFSRVAGTAFSTNGARARSTVFVRNPGPDPVTVLFQKLRQYRNVLSTQLLTLRSGEVGAYEAVLDSDGNQVHALASAPIQSVEYFVQYAYPWVQLSANWHASAKLTVPAVPDIAAYQPKSYFLTVADGSAPPRKIRFALTSGSYTATTTTDSGGDWLSVSPDHGELPTSDDGVAIVSIDVDPSRLTAGVYRGTVTVRPGIFAGPGKLPAHVAVILTVGSSSAGPVLFADSGFEALGYADCCDRLSTKDVGICVVTGNDCSPWPGGVDQVSEKTNKGSWLIATLVAGSKVRVTVDPTMMPVGSYDGEVTIRAGNQVLRIPVSLVVVSQAYAGLGSVVNAATASPGAVAPGEIVTIWGSFGSDVQLRVNGTDAFVLQADASHVLAVVPNAVTRSSLATFELRSKYQVLETNVPVVEASLGIFTLDGSGVGQAAVLNADNSINSTAQPATRGSVIQVFATGFGPSLPVLEIGGVAAPITFGGPAPGAVAGLFQINAMVPPDAASGDEVPIALRSGSMVSQDHVTIAVR